jgi:hypothetical protein
MQYKIKNELGKWVDGTPTHGQHYAYDNGFGGLVEVAAYAASDQQQTEKQWRNNELTRTDDYMMLPDFPYSTELAGYRQLLRDYDFSGERPSLPLTPTGKPIC